MRTNRLCGVALGILIGGFAIESNSQSAYFNAVTNLNPAGYWPMHEVEAAAQGDIETNYGTLGLLGTGYYPDWASADAGIIRGVPGVLTNNDYTAVNFTRGANPGNGTYTNAVYVPHTSPLTTLNPPFTVECWFYPTDSASSDDIWAQNGSQALNGGIAGGGAGSSFDYGLRLVWASGTGVSQKTGFELFVCDGTQNTAGFAGNTNTAPGNINLGSTNQSSPLYNWYDVVVTCDANTNWSVYTNGIQSSLNSQAGIANGPGSYTPDFWTPITVGSGKGGTRACGGYIDEFSVYTNVITDMLTHYNDAITGAPGQYFHDVTNDNPVVYLRMNAPTTYTPPGIANWPTLTSYGTTNGVAVGNGVYTPGTIPGLVTASPVNPNGVPFAGIPSHLLALSGMSTFGDAGNAAAFNPTGSNAIFTVSALFRGYPCDNRVQSIVGHGTNSWELSISTNGCLVFNAGNGNKAAGGTSQAAGDIRTRGVYNDGNWHQVVAMNQTNQVSIYVDGALDTNGTPAGIAMTNIIFGNLSDVLIGSDPTYTNNPAGAGRQFAGQICDVAFWTNALTASQVQLLYSNCQVAPYITTQLQLSYAANQGTDFTNMAVVANGSVNLSYQWYTNGVGLAGQTASNLILNPLTAANADADYYVIITNLYGSATSTVASLTVYGPPTFTNYFPVTYNSAAGTNFMNLYAGADPAFKVAVQGAQPIGLFWFTNGVNLAGQNGPSFTLTNVQVLGTLNISCVASNLLGLATNLWSATVMADPPNNANGLAPYPQQVLMDNPIGYWRLNDYILNEDGNGDNGSGDDGYIAYDYADGNDGIYTNVYLGQVSGYSPTTDPSDYPATFGEFTIPANNELAGQIRGIDFATTNGANGEFTVEAWVNGLSSGEVGYAQNTNAPVATKGICGVDDEFNLGIDASLKHYQFYVRSAGGTVYTADETTVSVDNNWHHLVGVCDEANGQLLFYGDGKLLSTAAIPTNSGVYEAPQPMTIGAGTVDGINYSNQFVGSLSDVAVYNYALSGAQVVAQFSVIGGVSPSLTQTPPTSVTLNAGTNLVLSATAIGSTPIGYYWADLTGGTNVAAGVTNELPLNAPLTYSNVPANWNNRHLELTVTNAYGSVSASVALTVFGAPVIINNLPPQVTLLFGSYTYSIGVEGIPPYGYQWYSGATPLANQTNATYTATVGNPGSSTTYYVVVTNIYGAVTSLVSTLTAGTGLTNAYAASILQFHPAGYWPMHEKEAPAPGDIETNYGTLGLLGTGYYPDWVANYGGIVRQVPGALAGDSDLADDFTYGTGNSGTTVSFTNGLYVPLTSPLTTLNPPFSVECWFYPINQPTGEAIWAQTGAVGLNDGGDGDLTNFDGIMLNWANGTFVPYGYNGENKSNGLTGNNNDKVEGPSNGTSGGSPKEAVDQWYQVVVTCDVFTNFCLYVNGSLSVGSNSAVGIYSPDYWTPLSIGCGNGGLRSSSGNVDEFSVYPTNLSLTQISNHYNAGTNASPATPYFQVVTNDNPVIYLRMDAAPYNPPVGNWPPLANYGSAPVNGFYSPGTMPGIVAGPNTNGVPVGGFSGTNVAQLSGVSSYADAGYDPSFNPTGSSQTLSVTAWFRGNPADGRFQNIIGHSDNSWRVALNTYGNLQFTVGNDTALTSTGVYNDGKWHQFVAVYNGPGGNEYLYVDGALDSSTAITGSSIAGSTSDVLIGSDPQYTNNPTGVGRQFAGQICEAAFFATALTAAQAEDIYAETIAPPINATPTNIVFSVMNNNLTLSWPTDHIGWQLQAQTNRVGVGISTNWANYNPSVGVNQVIIPINLTNGTVFYRLTY